jgi:hypothetical protein
MSDFHYDGFHLPDLLLQEAIAASNRANPDLVVLTGDFISSKVAEIHALIPWLQQLRSRLGTVAILGNHDSYNTNIQIAVGTALEQAGLHVLWNAIAYPFGPEFAVLGLADYWSPDFNPFPVFEQVPEEIPRLVLSHNPDSAVVLQPWRVDLQLSGHTHGGQIVIPGLGPVYGWLEKLQQGCPVLTAGQDVVVKNWQWSEGFHQVGSNRLYVNRGLGTYLPGRLFCAPEVTVITLV